MELREVRSLVALVELGSITKTADKLHLSPAAITSNSSNSRASWEVRTAAGTLIVLDCGTGAHGLGQALVAARAPVRGHLLITHTHTGTTSRASRSSRRSSARATNGTSMPPEGSGSSSDEGVLRQKPLAVGVGGDEPHALHTCGERADAIDPLEQYNLLR